LRMLLWLS